MSLDTWNSALGRASGLFGPPGAQEGMELVRATLGPPSTLASLARHLHRVGVSEEAAGLVESPREILRASPVAPVRSKFFRS